MTRTSSFAGVILSAGASARMGREKALLPWHGRPALWGHIRALRGLVETTLVVAGRNALNLQPIASVAGAALVVNPEPEQGQFSSLRTGLNAALARACDAAVISLVDHPPPRIATVAFLLRCYLEAPLSTWAVVPQYAGRHGHPIVVGRDMIAAFLSARPSSNAREVEHANQGRLVYVDVDDPGTVEDVDTPEAYAVIRRVVSG
jgi:molybdenum cofactor cytidylyltransferase